MAKAAGTGGPSNLDQALDELYGASPADFTGKRDALAKALKAAGDVDGSSALKAQRKPTQIAYVLNQLARRHADELADLVDVGRELARAQRKALRGEAGSDLRDAITRQRSVVAGLTAKTATLMVELGVPTTGHLDEIASALQAALVDPAVGAKLEEGRLDKVPSPAAGFPGASPQEAEPEPVREAQPVRAKPKPKADAHAKVDAKERPHAEAKASASASASAKETAKAHASAKAKQHAEAKARAEEKRREAVETKEKREAEREEKARAARKAAASSAGSEATERARLADAAERDADGLAAQAKKLDDEARALAAEAKRLVAEAKRVAREAEVAREHADRAATAAARAEKLATTSRRDADRAAKHAHSTASRV